MTSLRKRSCSILSRGNSALAVTLTVSLWCWFNLDLAEGAYFEPLSYIEARVELVPSLPLLHNLAMQSGILVVPVKGGFVEIWTHRDEELWGIFIIFSKHACVQSFSSFIQFLRRRL
jgi:hypothetical protein